MNRTIKEATVKRYHYTNHEEFKTHFEIFLNAYNFATRLKALKGLTPYEYIIKVWEENLEGFKEKLHHHNMYLNSSRLPPS